MGLGEFRVSASGLRARLRCFLGGMFDAIQLHRVQGEAEHGPERTLKATQPKPSKPQPFTSEPQIHMEVSEKRGP